MRFSDFWRSAYHHSSTGFRFIFAMHFFWVAPVFFIWAGAAMDRAPMLGWGILAAVGWVLTWVVVLVRHFRSRPGEVADLTPTVPLLVPGLMMVAGTFGAFANFS